MARTPVLPRPSPLRHGGFFALRMPALPVEALHRRASAQADDADLRAWVGRPEVRLALLLASPSLDAAVERWLQGADTGRAAQRTRRTLRIQQHRMAGRPTPFGLFASHSVGVVGEDTRLQLEPLPACRTHVQLDGDRVQALVRELEADPDIRARLRFHPNAGLYALAGRLRYVQAVREGASARNRYRLTEVQAARELRDVLQAAQAGATLAELRQALQLRDPSLPRERVRSYLEDLVESQLLQSELTPPATGPTALAHLTDTLCGLGLGPHPQTRRLLALREDLDRLGRTPPPEALAGFRHLLQALRGSAPGDASAVLQVDLHRPAPALQLSARRADEIARALPRIHALCPPRPRSDLEDFKKAFRARYQDRELPLLEVLDEDVGIGFDLAPAYQASTSRLLAGLPFHAEAPDTRRWGERDAVLLGLLCEVLRRGETVLRLGEPEFAALSHPPETPLPDALAVNFSLLGSPAEIEAEQGRVLWHGAFGPSGALYFGRFCHGDARLEAAVRDHLAREEALSPEIVHAELVHLPQGRTANLVARPVLRAYEIPYLARSGAARDLQIPVHDLRVSVQDERIRLRSARLGREVRVRLSAAHNASNAELGVYRFLSALRVQDGAHWLAWDWGPLQSAPFLPRVELDRIILSRARWRLTTAQLEALVGADAAARTDGAHRRTLGLPRWVNLIEGDRHLPLDLDRAEDLDALGHLARRCTSLDLSETWVEPEDLCVQTPEGRHLHEIVLPFTRTPTEAAGSRPAGDAPAELSLDRRCHPPGGEWIYLKAYGGVSWHDRMLRERLAPVLKTAVAAGDVVRWFFLRYADPDPHLRLRLRVPDEGRRLALQQALCLSLEPLVRRGVVWRLQFDTYDREIERYGGPEAIEAVEAIFQADSECALDLLAASTPEPDEDARASLALLGTHRLLEDLALPLDARVQVLGAMRDGLVREFSGGETMRHALDRKFRQERARLQQRLDTADASARRFELRSQALASPLQDLKRALEGQPAPRLANLALSLCHMGVNRLLRDAARAQEMVIYDGLLRLYQSEIARSASAAPTCSPRRP